MPRSSTLLVGAVWGGIAATTLMVRFYKRRNARRREEDSVARDAEGVQNAVEALEWYATHRPEKLALVGVDGDSTYNWKEYYAQVQQFARALKTTGDNHGVAIHAFNEPRWFFAAIGALAAGWTVSGIYLTNTYHQAAHVIRTSAVRVLLLESAELFKTTYKTVLEDFPELKVVLLKGGDDDDSSSRTPSYEAFLQSTRPDTKLTSPHKLPHHAVASLVYTSGTTGNPKAVQLTHANIQSVCAMMHARIPLNEDTVIVSYLPLSHIAAMGIDVYSPLFCGAQVHFADANALRGSLKDTLLRVRPTLFFGVPRVWEKWPRLCKMPLPSRTPSGVPGPCCKL